MSLKFLYQKKFIVFFYIFIIFFIDRITKVYVINLSEKYLNPDIFNSSFLNIYLIWNKGIAFGLFSFDQKSLYNFVTIIIIIIISVLIFLIIKSEKFKKFSYILVTGGALGNLFDRIVYSAVPDFIDIHYNQFHWFIFNVADIFITIGIICLIFDEFFLERKRYE